MQTDGQLYDISAPPSHPPEAKCDNKKSKIAINTDEILLLGLIYLIVSDKNGGDVPLLLALIYILMF